MSEKCPKCGYCPTCGRANASYPAANPWPWGTPWYPGTLAPPYITYGSGRTINTTNTTDASVTYSN